MTTTATVPTGQPEPTSAAWTSASLQAYVEATPNMEWSTETQDDYEQRYLRPVEQFGLTICLDPIETPREQLLPELMPRTPVIVDLIRTSAQTEGILLDVVDHYLKEPDDLFDPDGWFGNDIPVLYARPDGTYTVRDGNHRCIAAKLRGDILIEAHLVS